jgi:mono/diheme cytochrome c family protein
MDGRLFILFLLLNMALAGCGGETAASSAPATPPLPTLDAAQVAQRRAIYAQRCAACHGLNHEGAPGWPTPAADGLPPAPPHDDSGHT